MVTGAVDDLAGYLEAYGYGTVGTDIFKERMPPEPATCTVLYQYGGNEPSIVQDIEYPLIQVKTRADSRSTALQKIYNVWNIFDQIHNTTINGTLYLAVLALDSPTFMGYDRQSTDGYPVYGMNFKAVRIWR